MPPEQPLIEFLYAALHSKRGIVVEERSGNRALLKQRLYKERKSDPALAVISLTEDPDNPNALLLLRKEAKDE